ncbi:MAG: hypothetical protein QXS02_03675 [Candidatus Thermoplasmatota archaeon]
MGKMMDPEKTQDAPLGVLLIATFWIFLGTGVFSSIEDTHNIRAIIYVMVGMFFILFGWSLLSLKTWAYYVAIVFSVMGSLLLIYVISVLIIGITLGYFNYTNVVFAILFLLIPPPVFISMTWYLLKKKSLFIKQKQVMKISDCICPDCQRVIPFDANTCCYCGRKF